MQLSRELTCVEMVELVTEYLERNLSADAVARFELHLASCDGCTNYLEQMRVTIAVTGRLSTEDLPPDLRDSLIAAFRGWTGP